MHRGGFRCLQLAGTIHSGSVLVCCCSDLWTIYICQVASCNSTAEQTLIYQVCLGRLCGHTACFDCARHTCGMMGVFLRHTVRALCMSPHTGSVHVVKLGFPCALIVTHFVGVNESCTKLRGSLIFGSAVRPIPAGCYFLVVAIGVCAPQSCTDFGLAQPKLLKIVLMRGLSR
mgnify:CR=1 FL=1